MDMIGLMVAMFLASCQELPLEQSAEYRVHHIECGETSWEVWQHICHAPQGQDDWWGMPYFMREAHSSMAFYVNRFAEVQGGRGAHITDAYLPSCG